MKNKNKNRAVNAKIYFNKAGIRKLVLTRFSRQVLAEVCRIPLGQVRSYKWVAQKIKKPKAFRAVAQALKRNPFPIIIPCHRVINNDGKFGGYSGGAENKARLLRLERDIARRIKNI